jgi:hypothetical protein
MSFGKIHFLTAQLDLRFQESKGEITPEIEKQLLDLDISKAQAVDDLKELRDRIEMEVTYLKQKREELSSRIAGFERADEILVGNTKAYMEASGQKELLGNEVRYLLCGARATVKILDDEKALELYGKEKTQTVLDKDAIRKDLESGINLGCAILKENKALKPYAKRKELEGKS